MTSVAKIEFEDDLVREYSALSTVEQLGRFKCSMELYTEDGTLNDGEGLIEWIMDVDGDNEDVAAHIGVWWDENKALTDYDGCFSIPDQAIGLLRQVGIDPSYAED